MVIKITSTHMKEKKDTKKRAKEPCDTTKENATTKEVLRDSKEEMENTTKENATKKNATKKNAPKDNYTTKEEMCDTKRNATNENSTNLKTTNLNFTTNEEIFVSTFVFDQKYINTTYFYDWLPISTRKSIIISCCHIFSNHKHDIYQSQTPLSSQ